MALLREGLLTVCDHVHGGLFYGIVTPTAACAARLSQPAPSAPAGSAPAHRTAAQNRTAGIRGIPVPESAR